MRFRPRHYVLIAVILALGIYNLVRSRRAMHPTQTATVTLAPSGRIPQSAAWQAFDKAASLRDAPDTQFQPALRALHQQISSAPAGQKSDLNGCQTWLLFYRQNAHASATDAWKQRSTQHLSTCVSQHRDISQ
jgi:hypothetical protein